MEMFATAHTRAWENQTIVIINVMGFGVFILYVWMRVSPRYLARIVIYLICSTPFYREW